MPGWFAVLFDMRTVSAGPTNPPFHACRCMCAAIVCLMVFTAGCTLRASRQASLPPAPQPETVKPDEDAPLSIPQTSASLNVPREWNAAAIPPEQPPDPPAAKKTEAVVVTQNPVRPAGPPAKPPETAVTTTTTAVPEVEEPAPTPPVESEPAPFQPIVPVEQQNLLKTAIAQRKRDINNLLTKAGEHGGNDKTVIDRIKSFLNLENEAEKRGDYTQADVLCEKALVLAQDLKVE
jgi:hypothetical protein